MSKLFLGVLILGVISRYTLWDNAIRLYNVKLILEISGLWNSRPIKIHFFSGDNENCTINIKIPGNTLTCVRVPPWYVPVKKKKAVSQLAAGPAGCWLLAGLVSFNRHIS